MGAVSDSEEAAKRYKHGHVVCNTVEEDMHVESSNRLRTTSKGDATVDHTGGHPLIHLGKG